MNTIIENNTIVTNEVINNEVINSEVVKNVVDIAQARARAQVSDALRARVEQLATAREVWQLSDYARSNEKLYALIGECLSLYKDLTAKNDGTKALRVAFDDYLNTKGYVFKSSTELTNKVIRAVFGDKDRRRLSSYHVVLRVAVKQGWQVADVAAKIAEYGGVQEISLGSASGQLTAKQKAEAAKTAVNDAVVATLKSDELDKLFNAEHIGQKAVAVLTQEADGSYSVHAVVHNNTAVTAALAAYYSANKSDMKVTAEVQQTVDHQQQLANAIDAAAKSVVNG